MLHNNSYIKAYLNVIKESVVDIKKYQDIAKIIGGEYIPETNTIDCKGNTVQFYNEWLNEEGSFDFKLTNISNDWSYMFEDCDKLIYLPDDFTIPEGITDCSGIFALCYNLTHLPDNFIIPDSITDCRYMFDDCRNLKYLPNNFIIPNNVTNCSYMFSNCKSLTHLPTYFHIPNDVDCTGIFYECDKLENKDPKTYIMAEI